MAPPCWFTDSQEREVVQDYVNGATCRSLGKRHGCSETTITKVLIRHNTPRRPPGRSDFKTYPDEVQRDIERMWVAGGTLDEIAKKYSTSHHVIKRNLLEQGIEPNRRLGAGKRNGVIMHPNGYRALLMPKNHPFISMAYGKGRYILEHRLVVANGLGRPLQRSEYVHHINGDRLDNRPENLELRQGKHGKGVRMRCRCCGSYDIEAIELSTVGVEA